MPTSYYQAIPSILGQIQVEDPQSILDIGVGFGKYGLLCRDMLDIPRGNYHKHQWEVRIDGVEVFEGYRNPIHDYAYDKVYYGEITGIIDQLPSYDVILLIDVLEHFPKEKGFNLIDSLLKHTKKALVISTPLYPDIQAGYLGNLHEAHRSRWTILDFANFDFTYHIVAIGDGGAQVFKLYPRPANLKRLEIDSIWERDSTATEQLTIGYILPHHNLTGGLRMLLEQIRHLRQRHHRVRVLYRGEPGASVLPPWTDVEPDDAVLVPPGHSYFPHLEGCDIVMAGWLDQLLELRGTDIPVLYWEQGHEWLFGDINPVQAPLIRQHLYSCYAQPVALAAVSPIVASILDTRYGRKATVVPNWVDTDIFHPGEPADGDTILLVGNPLLRFKGFQVALRALERVWDAGYRFKVNWICQVEPHIKVRFPVKTIVNPPQSQLAVWFRQADIFLFTSWYEGFGMPPLEAMASGIPVVATSCGGINSYAVPGENALLAEPGDIDALAAGVIFLLEEPEARAVLGKNGRETALRFQWSRIIDRLETALLKVAGGGPDYNS